MKQSNSGLFQNMKASCFNSFILGDNSPQGTFDRSKEKISMLEFELEHNKDIIINLRRELISKNKEISLLKVNNNKRNEECQRTVRVIQEILKQCDPSTVAGFTAIDNSIQFNSEKTNDTKNKNNNNNNLPQIGNMLHFSSHHKKRFKEIIQVQMLKQQINSLNEELAKKNEEISQLKKSKNATNFTKLQNNFLKNFNELSKVKKENEFMKSKIEDVAHLYISQKENNFILKNRLQDFKGQFKDYKNSTVKKTNELKSLLLKAKKRERECKIFHLRKGKSMSAIGSGPLGRNKYLKNERYDNSYDLISDENNQKLNEEVGKMDKTMSLLKSETNNKDLEIKSLKIEKNNLNSKVNELQNQINKKKKKNISLDKQLQEVNNKKKFAEKDIKQQTIGANDIIKNLEKDNENLKNLNKNLQNKIDEKERQIEEENKYNKENNNKIEQKDKNDKSSINNSKKNNYIDNKDRNDINKKEEEDDKESYKFDDNENFENNKSNNDNKKKDSKNDELKKGKNENKSEKSSSKILPLLIDKIVYSNNSLKLKENEKQEELENIDDIKKNKNYDNISSKKNANEDDIDDRIFENY